MVPLRIPVTYQTTADVFVGGDVYTGPKFAIDAIAAGKRRNFNPSFCSAKQQSTIGRNPNHYIELDKDDIYVESYDNSSEQIPGHNDKIRKVL